MLYAFKICLSLIVGNVLAIMWYTDSLLFHIIQLECCEVARQGLSRTGSWESTLTIAHQFNNEEYSSTTREIAANIAHYYRPDTTIVNPHELLYAKNKHQYSSLQTAIINLWHNILHTTSYTPAPTDTLSHAVEMPQNKVYDANAILIIWGQIISLAILTIWARGVGPRFRPDQLSDLTWKDLVLFLGTMLVISALMMQ